MKAFLHIEAFFIFLAAIWANIQFEGKWGLFAFFAVLPDVALLAYLGNSDGKRWPPLIYNTFHL
jgi:hypothetical protein